MFATLTWRVAFLLGAAFLFAATLVARDFVGRQTVYTNAQQTLKRFEAVQNIRQQLERDIGQMMDRHARTLREARESASQVIPLEPLASASSSYLADLEKWLGQMNTNADTIRQTQPDGTVTRQLDRLTLQSLETRSQAQNVATALDSLLGAVSANDHEAMFSSLLELDAADGGMMAQLRTMELTVHRLADVQPTYLPHPSPSYAWLVVLLWLPAAFWWGARPIHRIVRIAQGRPAPDPPLTPEEAALRQRLQLESTQQQEFQDRLDEATRNEERTQQAFRRAENELALLRLYNENMVNSIRSAIVVSDAAGNITATNRSARQLLSIPEDAIGMHMSALPVFQAFTARLTPEAISRALAERQVLRVDAIPFQRPQGGEILLDLTVAPYLDEIGSARGLLWVSDDVSDAVRLKNQLLAAEHLAAVGRVSAQVAHEIRNPLSAIGLNAELLEEEFLGILDPTKRAEARSMLNAIANEIGRLTAVTESYLRLARLPRPDFHDADLNQITNDLLTMLSKEMKARNIQLQIDFDASNPRVWVDPGQLRQAMLNIIRNSRDAMPEGGSLRLKTQARGDHSEVTIEDTGPGIPKETLPRIFEPFFSTKPEGTGLGLSLTEQILSEHGGRIRIEAIAPHGTRVILTLPATPAPARSASTDASAEL